MKKSRFTEAQIIGILNEQSRGLKVSGFAASTVSVKLLTITCLPTGRLEEKVWRTKCA